jgi:phosphotransferase system enzyme I (PtsI)
LKLLKGLVLASRQSQKDLSLCGEIAGEPLYLPLLLGLGFRFFSVAPVLLPDLADYVTRLRLTECELLAQEALKKATADEVYALLKAFKR